MTAHIDHIAGVTYHGRKGGAVNAFRYTVDYVLLDPEADLHLPTLFSRTSGRIMGLRDRDHGGPPGEGHGVAWVRDALHHHQLHGIKRIELLAQPRVLGHVFNPVSFWLCWGDDAALVAVIAEVTNTYGDRHSYLCHHSDLRPIEATDRLCASKVMHVSPFQPVEGHYEFRFDIRPDRIGIWINYSQEDREGGLIATLTGPRTRLSNAAIVKSLLRRPFGARRVLGLIHWQALKLWAKRQRFLPRPIPPQTDITQGWQAPRSGRGQ